MNTHKRNDYSLLTYYADYSVSKEAHQLIINLPAFITDDPTQFCHYYVESNVMSISCRKKSNIKNKTKYNSRSQKMFNLTKKTNDSINNKQTSESKLKYELSMSMLTNINPLIKIIKQQTLINIIKPFIDTRCDEILNQNNNKHSNEISYFLMDNNAVFKKIDNGYHIKNVEQYHFGGDYGANYKGSLFVDPEQYKLYKSEKLLNKKNKHLRNINKNKKEKVCHGCRTKYMSDEWETHIKTDTHQKFLCDPAFVAFNEYANALNERLENTKVEKKAEFIFDTYSDGFDEENKDNNNSNNKHAINMDNKNKQKIWIEIETTEYTMKENNNNKMDGNDFESKQIEVRNMIDENMFNSDTTDIFQHQIFDIITKHKQNENNNNKNDKNQHITFRNDNNNNNKKKNKKRKRSQALSGINNNVNNDIQKKKRRKITPKNNVINKKKKGIKKKGKKRKQIEIKNDDDKQKCKPNKKRKLSELPKLKELNGMCDIEKDIFRLDKELNLKLKKNVKGKRKRNVRRKSSLATLPSNNNNNNNKLKDRRKKVKGNDEYLNQIRKKKNMRKCQRMTNNSLSCLDKINGIDINSKYKGICCPGYKLEPMTITSPISGSRYKVKYIGDEYVQCKNKKCNNVYPVK